MQRHNQTVFSVEHLQSTWLSKRRRILYQWCVRLVDGLSFRLFYRLDTEINPAEALTWSWKKARSGLVLGLLSGPVIGLLIWSSGKNGLVGGLIFGLVVGLGGGLSARQLPDRRALSPNEGIWRSGKNGLVLGLLFWLISGLFRGLDAFVKHFVLRFFLSLRGDLPWNLVSFLDKAEGRLLLRKVGGSYMFVHRLLLDYFAALDGSMSSKDTSSGDKTEKHDADV